jgi:predicted nucleic acid-binding protein
VKAVFADTYFYLALLDNKDAAHVRASEFGKTFKGFVVTSRWVLLETANALSGSRLRDQVAEFFRDLERRASVKIVHADEYYFRQGLELYAARADKEWSLTDCISFCIMKYEGLQVALTRDHHFAQAGFVPLFADPQ